MLIRIAAVASEEFMPRILANENDIENIKFIPYIYEQPTEAGEVVERIEDCDVVLFAGPLPYFFAREKVQEKRWPSVYIASDEFTITQTLFHTMLQCGDDLQRISIDTPKITLAQRVKADLELTAAEWHLLDYSQIIEDQGTVFDLEEIIAFHHKLWIEKRITRAFTSVDYVYKRLQSLEIPCISMIVPEKNIQEAISKAAAHGQLVISQNAQIAIGLAVVNPRDESDDQAGSSYTDAAVVLQQMLLELGQETDASVQRLGIDQFIIYGTRGSIEQMTGHFRSVPFLKRIDQLLRVRVSMGFGFGLTAKEAEGNARVALFHAKKHAEASSAYLVTDEKVVVGPLDTGMRAYQLKSENQDILQVAEKTGVSVVTVNKLSQLMKLRRENRFTANDLAEYLQVSRRSAERMLKKFVEQKFVEIIGEEQPYQQGRPRAVYRMNFP